MPISKRNDVIKFDGRILYLTADPKLVRRQLDGEELDWTPDIPLADNISTDEITPARVCYYYDEMLGRHSLVGFREQVVRKDDIKNGGFAVIVSGISKGCGSSRETAPYSEKWAGVQLIVAKTIEKIYGQNSQNIGLLTTNDFTLLERIKANEEIPLSTFTEGLDPVSHEIVEYGGLFQYNRARLAGEVTPPVLTTEERPMTLVEKIIARSAIADAKTGQTGIVAVKPEDALFVRCGIRFSHEYVTPMAASLFSSGFDADARVTEPESIYAFRDHLTYLDLIMTEEQKGEGLLDLADDLAVVQRSFCKRQGIKLYDERQEGGSEAICHNAVLEELAMPADLVVGTDSHTCTAGAVGCFAFGVGSTDMANAWFTRDVRVKVPETVRIELRGEMAPNVSAKDVVLFLMAKDYFRQSKAIGKVLEFCGSGVKDFSIDERATLTNMAVEGGAFSGIVEADEVIVDYLSEMRGLGPEAFKGRLLRSDPEAEYAAEVIIDLAEVPPMVALPGDPRNGLPITELEEEVSINIAYGGSCTGGKRADMDMYASVLSKAVEEGRKVHPDVDLFIQFGSQKIKAYAQSKGYIELFERAGAQLVNPSCGACINSGPGVSFNASDVTVSAQNRNYRGRSGPGDVYLASPLVVAASALAGKIVLP